MTEAINKVDTDGNIITVPAPKRLTVYLQGDTWEKLQRLAAYFGLSVSQMVSSQTRRSFMKHKKSIEIVEKYTPSITVPWKEMADQANAAHLLNEGEKES